MALCPYCNYELEMEDVKRESEKLSGTFHKVNMYFSPNCNKILGFSEAQGK